jgi:hypothetical protein
LRWSRKAPSPPGVIHLIVPALIRFAVHLQALEQIQGEAAAVDFLIPSPSSAGQRHPVTPHA